MRNIYVLSEAIKNEIPNTSDGLKTKYAIDEITDCFRYTAPEMWADWYQRIAILLQNRLGVADTEWKKRIADIFADVIKIKEEPHEPNKNG